MGNNDLAERIIYWNIPESFKVIMYLMFIVSLGFFLWGYYKKFAFITGEKKLLKMKNSSLFEKLNILAGLKVFLTTGKVPRFKEVAKFHSLIYFGFFVLWIATDLVAIHVDTPLKIFKGPVYIVVSFLADFAGLAILLGIGLAYKRRYIDAPKHLSATRPSQEKFMYLMLIGLVILGYLLEGIRIAGTALETNEMYWSPVGYQIATLFKSFNMSDPAMGTTFKYMWLVHMIHTMVFIACIPFTKFSHIFMIPLSTMVTPKRRGAVLSPMNFEDENAETFGLGKLSEMTDKNKFDLLTCVECGRCTQVCPANNAGKILDPKLIITKARDLSEEVISGNKEDVDFWESETYQSNEIDACTTCGACMEECPANIEHVNVIMELKRYKALTLGDLPPSAADATNKIRINGNPWGITQDDRFKWADGLEVPVIEAGKKVDYLYYVGCAGSYDAANQQVVKDTVTLLKKAGVSFAVMGKTEKCNGDPIRRFGDEYSFFEVAIENIANMNKYDFDKVVTHCPHCLHTIGKEYAKFDDGDFNTVHHTELLADLVQTGKLKPQKEINEELTFHDPCYLGRHHGEYNAPREILKSIPGVKITEMEKNKDKALCCGMGGGNMWYELPEGDHLAQKRLEDVVETKTQKMATACSYCMINFNSSRSQVKETEDLEIEDIASILAKSVQ